MTTSDSKPTEGEDFPDTGGPGREADAGNVGDIPAGVPFDDAEGGSDPSEAPGAESPETGEPGDAERHEAAKWKEVAMRTAADLENFRKRAAREREESMRYANQSLLEDLLPILDNFEMGMRAAEQEKDSMVYVGMNMVRQQFADFMAAQGVAEIHCQGEAFDPNRHEAVSEEESEDCPPGHVLRVTRRGFMLRDRLLRPASVVVAKEPGDPAADAGSPESESKD
jgi:molecular chaperone GrpE